MLDLISNEVEAAFIIFQSFEELNRLAVIDADILEVINADTQFLARISFDIADGTFYDDKQAFRSCFRCRQRSDPSDSGFGKSSLVLEGGFVRTKDGQWAKAGLVGRLHVHSLGSSGIRPTQAPTEGS